MRTISAQEWPKVLQDVKERQQTLVALFSAAW
jgi:hypothetical protein